MVPNPGCALVSFRNFQHISTQTYSNLIRIFGDRTWTTVFFLELPRSISFPMVYEKFLMSLMTSNNKHTVSASVDRGVVYSMLKMSWEITDKMLAEGWKIFQNGCFMWLLECESQPHEPTHRFAWAPLQYGSQLAREQVIQERERNRSYDGFDDWSWKSCSIMSIIMTTQDSHIQCERWCKQKLSCSRLSSLGPSWRWYHTKSL